MKISSLFWRVFFGGVVAIVVFGVDQFIKYAIRQGIALHEEYAFGIFKLTYYKNTGIAFGIPFPQELLYVVVIAVLLVLLYHYRKKLVVYRMSIPLTLIFAGALSNMFDRIIWGYVLDYVSIWIFPVFNVADLAIVVGVVLVVFQEFFRKEEKSSRSTKGTV